MGGGRDGGRPGKAPGGPGAKADRPGPRGRVRGGRDRLRAEGRARSRNRRRERTGGPSRQSGRVGRGQMISTLPALAACPADPAPAWDSWVFVLRGDDRECLRDRAVALGTFLEARPETGPTDLAATLVRELEPGGSRLALVASSILDLRTKLGRSTDRLADPSVRPLRDAAGAYFFPEPLYTPGSLALLFPGEGAQYLNMLADWCGVFPEVGETFGWCDRIAAETGRPSLRRILHLPPDATPAERATAEFELRRIGPSIFAVLVADLAIARVLENLQVPVSAVAGHSAGELAALPAAGAIPADAFVGQRLAQVIEVMERQEHEGAADVTLIAVGAGQATVREIADAVASGAVIVAMDNCPHQCVAVGPTHLVAAVASALSERGVLCDPLPFRRPYHTPLFEPWMGPFRELFAGVPFQVPRTTVYSCSTGRT